MKTQNGRSMIEMLGVLAIIGVLSVGGLAGYTRAMRAYRVNETLDYIHRCYVEVRGRGNGVSGPSPSFAHIAEWADAAEDCTDVVGPLPTGLAAAACIRWAGGKTGCQFTYSQDALRVMTREKVGITGGESSYLTLDCPGTGWANTRCY